MESLDKMVTELKDEILQKDRVIAGLKVSLSEVEERLAETEKQNSLTLKRLGTKEYNYYYYYYYFNR